MFWTIYVKASQGKVYAPWAQRYNIGRRNMKHQYWSAVYLKNQQNYYIYFVENPGDITMCFSVQPTQWVGIMQNYSSIVFIRL